MRLDDRFEVSASPASVWEILNDVPAVVPCLPGAELTETVGDDCWKALVQVKLGPIAFQFETTVTRQVTDEAARRVVLDANARELRGRGGAHATISSTLSERDGTTVVDLVTDLTLKGSVAQFGRGVVPSVASRLTRQFADNLAALMQAADVTSDAQTATPFTAPRARRAAQGLWHALRGLSGFLRRRRQA
jgi:carbon monoxide dehydrogenase subunit G